jgi:hypothetical protein
MASGPLSGDAMRTAMIALCLSTGVVFAQTTPPPTKDTPNAAGRANIPEKKEQTQPQGNTGPLNTTSGGTPAASPQGDTPPGMQPAPEGSSKQTK